MHLLQRFPKAGRPIIPRDLQTFDFGEAYPIVSRPLPTDAALIVEDRLKDPAQEQNANGDAQSEVPDFAR